jgi:integrase
MLYKRGRAWWIKIKWQRKLIRRSTLTSSKELARKIEIKILNELAEGEWFGIKSQKRTLNEMIERYENEYTAEKDYYQNARDKSIFKHLRAYFGEDTQLRDFEKLAGEYESYRHSKGVMPGTILKELGLLKRIFNIAIKKWKWLKDNPVSSIEMPKVKNERVRYLTEDEYNRLFTALDDKTVPMWLKPAVVIALNTGLRESNLLKMKWSWIDLFSRLLIIEGPQMKNKENIGLPLTHEAIETFKEMQKVKHIEDFVFHDNGKRIHPVKLQRVFRNACKVAQIENFHFHDLRHTFASYLRQRGVDLHTISKLLGHKDTRMTQRYAHLSVENLREAISVLDMKPAQKGAQSPNVAVCNEG